MKPGPNQLALHEIYRTPQRDRDMPISKGLRNLYVVTGGRDREIPLGRGINSMAHNRGVGVTPAVVISSSPWKAGTDATPWHDVFDVQSGRVRYFGDAKVGSSRSAESELGNAALLAEYTYHRGSTPQDRMRSTPLIVFRAVRRDGADKGYREFCGLGIIERVERVVQWDDASSRSFSNYAYDISLLDLSRENELFDWHWINQRAEAGAEEAMPFAPDSWKKWVDDGDRVLPKIRHRAPVAAASRKSAQLPPAGSRDAKVLQQIYGAFVTNKHAFESLASKVVGRILKGSGSDYINGWITKASGDNGIDFVSRLDVGNGSATVKLVVLGQAKCTKPSGAPISAGDLARVVARLRRGYLGAYVTTATYSEPAQIELRTDEYPLLLVNGAILAAEVRQLAAEAHGGDVDKLLGDILLHHDSAILNRRPEQILDIDGTYAHEP